MKGRRNLLKAGALAAGALVTGAPAVADRAPSREKPVDGQRPLYSKHRSPANAAPKGEGALSPPPDAEVRALRRLTYGFRPEDVAYFNSLGANFDDRLEAWVDEQLAGYQPGYPPENDPELRAVIDDPVLPWQTLDNSLTQLWQERTAPGLPEDVRDLPTYETQTLLALRAVYSRWQLAEVLADFWHVHFTVFGGKGEVRSTTVHYDRDVIRAHMLGNFRQFLEAVTKSCAMMHYLDNLWNSSFGPQENFARELQELHTLGAVHAWGFTPEEEIPDATPIPGSATVLPAGLKAGYSERDVRQVTLALTGWTIDRREITGVVPDTGAYFFLPDWHDDSQKRVLGLELASSGEDEVHEILDLLAMHPSTARYVCSELCRKLVNDDPPAPLVEKAAAVFNDQWEAPDQLAQVVRTIILSDEFKDVAHWTSKVKKPFELVCGAARSCGGFTTGLAAWNDNAPGWGWWLEESEALHFSRDFYWALRESGGMPLLWVTPDGYPDRRDAWLSSSPLVLSWKLINILFWRDRPSNPPDNTEWYTYFPVDAVAVTLAELPAGDRTPAILVDFWVHRVLGYDAARPASPQLSAAVRERLVAFMQQDAPSADQVLDLEVPPGTDSPERWRAFVPERLQTLVASIAMLPDNLLR